VKLGVDLIDSFTNLVVRADDPRGLAERTLDVVISLTGGRAAAVFTRDAERVVLFASRGIDQEVLDAVEAIWSRHRAVLEKGEAFYVPDRVSDRRMPAEQRSGEAASLVVVPVLDDGQLVALLYVDGRRPQLCAEHDLERLAKFSRIVAKAVADAKDGGGQRAREVWEDYLERTPPADMEREKLLLLLNRNEWNIARVSRLMGVTRRTIYLRLARFNIPRERVRKTRPKPATS
jgi:transcriptional regulator with GAF, ATPase, and Fis domain